LNKKPKIPKKERKKTMKKQLTKVQALNQLNHVEKLLTMPKNIFSHGNIINDKPSQAKLIDHLSFLGGYSIKEIANVLYAEGLFDPKKYEAKGLTNKADIINTLTKRVKIHLSHNKREHANYTSTRKVFFKDYNRDNVSIYPTK
jgi:hypothetical protein